MAAELVKALKALPADPQHRFRVAIAFHGLTQTELARALGIDPGALSNALNGNRDLTETQERAIADRLDVPVAILFAKVAA